MAPAAAIVNLWASVPLQVPISIFFLFVVPPTTTLYTLSLHDALPISKTFQWGQHKVVLETGEIARQASGAVRSEEHTSELQSHVNLVCRLLLEKKKRTCTSPRRCRCRTGSASSCRSWCRWT